MAFSAAIREHAKLGTRQVSIAAARWLAATTQLRGVWARVRLLAANCAPRVRNPTGRTRAGAKRRECSGCGTRRRGSVANARAGAGLCAYAFVQLTRAAGRALRRHRPWHVSPELACPRSRARTRRPAISVHLCLSAARPRPARPRPTVTAAALEKPTECGAIAPVSNELEPRRRARKRKKNSVRAGLSLNPSIACTNPN